VAVSVPPAPAPQPTPAPSPAPSQPPVISSVPTPPAASAPFTPGEFVEQGIASWYGAPFDGRRAADGEVYDMNTMVAAHRTLPFGSIVRVTNLNNGRQAEVRIIDRGPFVQGRILDLSRAAAQTLGMIGTGTAPVRIQLLSGPNPSVGNFAVQVGAFTVRANADRLRDRLSATYQPVLIQEIDAPNGHFYRVRVGSVSSIEAAQELAARLREDEGFQGFVIRLDPPGSSAAQ
jgi:peptidoglycan lytic transglycosylase